MECHAAVGEEDQPRGGTRSKTDGDGSDGRAMTIIEAMQTASRKAFKRAFR